MPPNGDEEDAHVPKIAPVLIRRGTMMKIEEVAARWCLNIKTVYAMIQRGELPAARFGRVIRIPRSVVEIKESQGCEVPGDE